MDIRHNAKIFREKLRRVGARRAAMRRARDRRRRVPRRRDRPPAGRARRRGAQRLARRLPGTASLSACSRCAGDVADAGAVGAAVEGCEVVFHVAAGRRLGGLRRLLPRQRRRDRERSRRLPAAGVRRLVYTSSPSVVFDGRDMEGVDESVPFPKHYDAAYPQTKAKAERLVLAANGPDLATVALRPHLIWGPGDNHLVPRIIARAKAGRLRRVGRGQQG